MGGVRTTTESYIQKAMKVHGDRYTYDKLIYTKSGDKLEIGCKIDGHGYFFQRTDTHLEGKGCPKCGGNQRKTTEQFIEQAKKVYGDLYGYVPTIYINGRIDVSIKCQKHGIFTQRPDLFLAGHACQKCSREKTRSNTEEFIQKAKKIHGDKYIYDKIDYQIAAKDVEIICPIDNHGIFLQSPSSHLVAHGCPKCAGNQRKTTEQFIEQAIKVHGSKYSYNRVNYIKWDLDVEITCPRDNHGIFLQQPSNHLRGQGCPKCCYKSEAKVGGFLQYTFPNLSIIHGKEWHEVMENKRPDFRIPDLKLILEYNGEQHFKQVANWKHPDMLQRIDIWKSLKAMNSGYSVIHIRYDFIKKDNWKNLLLPHLVLHNMPCIIWAGKHKEHELLYNKYKDNINAMFPNE